MNIPVVSTKLESLYTCLGIVNAPELLGTDPKNIIEEEDKIVGFEKMTRFDAIRNQRTETGSYLITFKGKSLPERVVPRSEFFSISKQQSSLEVRIAWVV